eukprot:CAMPEP_0177693930 /NCGR_PEP_ID=MMETSP0484_2-20121128/2664_1 /TAXON_ID=354590 /ORGANISM="Rhodomonas lens, Strain RHODO" /LENGTH=175 /DNA_ID=CAMNT_0019204777 /DNA_START=80 /DNA_END=607 /DNA_ORIENTATION=-
MGNAESLDAACCSKRELGHDDQDLMTRSDHHRRQQTTSSQKPGPTTCGIGLGLNAKLLSSRTGAVVNCIAKGGPCDSEDGVKIGDTIVSIGNLDVREIMNNPSSSRYDLTRGITPVLASALHGEPGTSVKVGVIRRGFRDVLYKEVKRAPLPQGCQWISAIPDEEDQFGGRMEKS